MLLLGGAVRLALSPTAYDATVALTVVQPNIAQRDKADFEKQADIFETHLRLSRFANPSPEGGVRVVLWPENAAPFILSYRSENLSALAEAMRDDLVLASGSVRLEIDEERRRFYNALHVFSQREGGLSLEATYDKHHLAPFGEFVPLAGLMARLGVSALSAFADGGFTRGEGPRTLSVGDRSKFCAVDML